MKGSIYLELRRSKLPCAWASVDDDTLKTMTRDQKKVSQLCQRPSCGPMSVTQHRAEPDSMLIGRRQLDRVVDLETAFVTALVSRRSRSCSC